MFYIDFGNIEQVEALNLRKLLPQFMVLPAQVVRCSLADVYPSVKQTELDVFHDGEDIYALSVLNCSLQRASKGRLLLIQCYYRRKPKLKLN